MSLPLYMDHAASTISFPYDHTTTRLMGGKDKHLCDLHMLRSIGGIDGDISDVITCQGHDTRI